MRRESPARILAVDDEPQMAEVIKQWLVRSGYECQTATSAQEALKLLEREPCELVISDIRMPGTGGIELLEYVKEQFPDIAVIMATAVDKRETAIQTLKLGAYGYVIKPFDSNELLINVANALERRRLFIESRDYENRLENEVLERTADIRRREEEIAIRLVSAADFRDEETGAHVRRLGLYSMALAREIGWSSEHADSLRVAAPMHDVGKIGIPDEVLRKPGKLTPEEFEIIKTHTEIGAKILGGSDIPLLQMATDIALYHHEKVDGSGYPKGIEGGDIPEAARIVALVDVYDALVNDRVYRAAMPEEKALAIMTEGRASHFDAEIFDCFLQLLPEFRNILARHSDENEN